MIAKLPAADETSRATARSLGSYENEVRFYQLLAPELPMRTPAVYYADIDVETASFVLLLEDMAPAEQGDQLRGCSPETAKVAVDELVRLHAPRWDDPTLEAFEWLHRDRAAQRAFLMAFLPGAWDGFRDAVRRAARRRRPRRRRRACSRTSSRTSPSTRDRGRSSTATTGSTTCCSTPRRAACP